jgi:hypothetical protein
MSELTEYDKNELAFLASRNELEMKFHEIREFLQTTSPSKIGQQRYQNLFTIAGLGLTLILENKLMWDEIENLRGKIRRLDAEAIDLLKQNNELMKKQ